MSSETDSLMSKICQMEAYRRKSDERIRQLEAALQSHAHLTAPSSNVGPVTRPIYPSPSSVQPSSVADGQPLMSPVVGTLTPESYSSVMSGGPPPPATAGYGRGRKARDRRRPGGCPACQLPDGTVAPSCSACRPPGCHNCSALDHWKRDCPVSRQGASSVAYSKGANGGQSCGQVYLWSWFSLRTLSDRAVTRTTDAGQGCSVISDRSTRP